MCRLFAFVPRRKFHDEDRRDHVSSYLTQYLQLATAGNVMPGRDPGHQDGWGIASLKKGKWKLVKECIGANHPGSICAETFVETAAQDPDLIIAHFRKASHGAVALGNTHPFYHSGLVFCHNGDVIGLELSDDDPELEGTTDSERYFRALAYKATEQPDSEVSVDGLIIESLSTPLRTILDADGAILSNIGMNQLMLKIREIRETSEYSSLTMLMGSANKLCAYREYNRQHPNYPSEVLQTYYTLYLQESDAAVIVCSEPIGSGMWRKLDNCEMVIIDLQNGEVRSEVVV